MIDINLIRNSPDLVKENVRKKFQEEKLIIVDKIIKKDSEWRKIKSEADKLRAFRNTISKKISAAKKAKKEAEAKKLL